MIRYKAIVEYRGCRYYGMQRQPGNPTIQGSLESSLSKLFNQQISIDYSGRTDRGVHAMGQVIHFDAVERSTQSIIAGANTYLKKDDICVLVVEKVADSFHSRFSAKRRWYLYKIINRNAPLTFCCHTHLHVRKLLNISHMRSAGKLLLGRHDFASFRDKDCQAIDTWRTLEVFELLQQDDEIILHFAANAFLHHMVRNIVGTLLEIGYGKEDVAWITEILHAQDRSGVAHKVGPHGLYLWKVDY